MKKLNKMVVFALLTAMAHVSLTQCMEKTEKGMLSNMDREVKLQKKTLIGLTGLAAGSFVGKKIFNNLSVEYPTKKEQYLKYARYSRNFSRLTASPAIGLMTCMVTAMASVPFSSKLILEPLVAIAKLSLVPYHVMVRQPVKAYVNRQN